MQQHKKLAGNDKSGVPRHTRFAKSSAHRCEKRAETRVRRAGKQGVIAQLGERQAGSL